MSEICYDGKYSMIEINNSLGINLTSNDTRIKHIGTNTFNIESTEGDISIQSSNTTDGIRIGTTGNVPIRLGNSIGNIILGGDLVDSNTNELIKLSTNLNAVNEITIDNAITTNGAIISATGDDINIDLNFQSKGTGTYNFYGSATSSSKIALYEDTDNGTNSVTVQAPSSISSSYTLTLPGTDGNNNQYLKTNGTGTLSWAIPTSSYTRTVVNTSTYTVLSTDDIVGVAYTTIGECTITLPVISSIGETRFSIVDEGGNSGTYNIIITYASGNFLLGSNGSSNTYVINSNYASITIYNDGDTNWFIC
jgi:hypothetical protein